MEINSKILNTLWKIEDRILQVCLGVMGIAIFTQVVTRYVLKTPLIWSEELARYIHVWICFLGLGYGVRNKAHVRVEFFLDKMPAKVKSLLLAVTDLLSIAFMLFFIPGTFRFVADQALIKSSAMEVPMNIVYIVLPIGIFSAIITLLIDAWINIRSMSAKKAGEV